MAKSIETSLQIITSQSETNSEEFESFTDAIPQTRIRAAKKSSERKSKPKGEAKAHQRNPYRAEGAKGNVCRNRPKR